jgi:toxin ParE1/3/4
MSLYRLSKDAEQDLEDLWVYLAQRNDIAGDRRANSRHNASKIF